MEKINRNTFLSFIVNNNDCIGNDGCVSNLKNGDVVEFKVGNKYFYRLAYDSHIRVAQESLSENFLSSIQINNSAVAYRRGISYFNLFEPHRNGYYFLRLDISSFFYSIQEDLLKQRFSNYFTNEFIDDDENQTLLEGFIALTTYKIPSLSLNERFRGKVVLPIGFMTSPVISNIVFRRLDILIQKYCALKNIAYSRYADDMLFSSPVSFRQLHSDSFLYEIKYLLSIDGFKLNKRKTIKTKHTISLNGYILSNENAGDQGAFIRISNKKTKIVNKLVYMLKNEESNEKILTKLFGFKVTKKCFKYFPPKEKYLKKYCEDQVLNKMTGYRSYLISIIKFNEKYKCVNSSAIEKYTNLVEVLNKYIMISENK